MLIRDQVKDIEQSLVSWPFKQDFINEMKLVSIYVQQTDTSKGHWQPLILAKMDFTQTFSHSDIFPNMWMDTTNISINRKFMPSAESRI